MYRVSVIYGIPKDPEAFREHYASSHISLVKKMPLRAWNLTWVDQSDNDGFPPIFLIADLYTETKEQMDAVLGSPEGQAAAADVANFATGGAFFIFGEQSAVE